MTTFTSNLTPPPDPDELPEPRHHGRVATVGLVLLGALGLVAMGLLLDYRAEVRFDRNAGRITELDREGTESTNARIEAMDHRTTTMDERLGRVGDRLGKAEAEVVELHALIADLNERLAAAEAQAAEARRLAKARPVSTSTRARSSSVSAAASSSPVPMATGGSWAALAACESTGDNDGAAPHRIDPRAVSSTGKYRGAFQWSMSTWQAAGGTGDPVDASYEVELARAQAWAARSDVNARTQWPTCWPMVMGNTPT